MLRLFAMVAEGFSAATACFLAGDRETARRLVADDPLIDELQAVKLLLGDLVAQQTALATSEASRFLAVWNDLSVHTASTLSTLDLHSKATAVLRRAVIATRSGLSELTDSSG